MANKYNTLQLKIKQNNLKFRCKLFKDKLKSIETTKLLFIRALKETQQELQQLTQKQTTGTKQQLILYCETENDYFKILPEEILELILGYVKAPQDLFSCSLAFRKFNKILQPFKPRYLFKLILPRIIPNLRRKDILLCRGVCKKWKDILDELIQITPFQEPKLRQVKYEQTTRILYTQDMTKFTDQMGNYPGNPFVGRQVVFEEETIGNTMSYWDGVLQFLEKFGRHIWVSGFNLDRHAQPSQQARVFSGCLNALQGSLKRLCVNGGGVDVGEDTLEGIMGRIQAEADGYPQMDQMFSLKINMAPGYMTRLLFLKYAQQLRQLELLSVDFDCATGFSTGVNIELPNLDTLGITVLKQSWMNLGKLHVLKSPLKKLDICVANDGNIKIENVLDTLEHFKETLQHVRVEWLLGSQLPILSSASSVTDHSLGMCFPNVTVLELENYFESLNYLLCFPSLEQLYLTWVWSKNSISCGRGTGAKIMRGCATLLEKAREEEFIQVYGFLERMYKSNIWSLFPVLEKFQFEKESTSRGDFEEEDDSVNSMRDFRMKRRRTRKCFTYTRKNYIDKCRK